MIQFLFNRSNAARILAVSHIHNLLRQLQAFLLNPSAILDDVHRDIRINVAQNIQIQINRIADLMTSLSPSYCSLHS